VLRRDNSCFALLGDGRIDRDPAGSSTFRAGPIELTPAQKQRGWHISVSAGAGALELRNLRLRDRAQVLGTPLELFDGKSLAGWSELGDAKFSVLDGELCGEVGGGAQSFLRTDESFGDFVLELDLRNDAPGNSGVQVRSRETQEKRLRGYQIEVDPLARAWSGGLYDEARRGWLDDLSDNPQGRAAFQNGSWNHYRIECVGPWIRAWVNDVPTADYLDAQDLEGVIGLQVHSGKDTKMRWRKLRLTQLGKSRWLDAPRLGEAAEHGANTLRLGALPSGGGTLRVELQEAAFAPGARSALEALNVLGGNWQARVSVDLPAKAAHTLLVMCYPPRLAVEIDGQRLPAASWRLREPGGPDQILLELGCARPLLLIRRQVLTRE
jgi:hypothetical protein